MATDLTWVRRFTESNTIRAMRVIGEWRLCLLVPVWYEWQDGSFVIVAWPNSVWASFLVANPTVALSIDEPWPPMRRVMIRGEASLLPHHDIPGGIDNLRHRISTLYLGAAHALSTESVLNSTAWSAFRITPHQCIALREKQPEG